MKNYITFGKSSDLDSVFFYAQTLSSILESQMPTLHTDSRAYIVCSLKLIRTSEQVPLI